MALYDQWTLAQLRQAVQRELMDPTSKWWASAELNQYITDWQNRIQDELELVWGTATQEIGVGTSTLHLPSLADDILRVDDIRWNGVKLSPQTIEDMNRLYGRNWRANSGEGSPMVVWQEDSDVVNLWPPPQVEGQISLEYPRRLEFESDSSQMELPPWTRYTVKPYTAMRAYMRRGPNMNIQKSLRRKAAFHREMVWLGDMKDAYFPKKFFRMRPGGDYEGRLVTPARIDTMPVPATSNRFSDEIPSGVVNGTNPTFTLAHAPDPTVSLKLWVDGLLMKQGDHYTLSGSTITFVSGWVPISGQFLFASYRYLVVV